MTTNEIKKLLYTVKPFAKFKYIQNGKAFYQSKVGHTYNNEHITTFINFEIPVNDMGEAKFETHMDGKLLIRWLI